MAKLIPYPEYPKFTGNPNENSKPIVDKVEEYIRAEDKDNNNSLVTNIKIQNDTFPSDNESDDASDDEISSNHNNENNDVEMEDIEENQQDEDLDLEISNYKSEDAIEMQTLSCRSSNRSTSNSMDSFDDIDFEQIELNDDVSRILNYFFNHLCINMINFGECSDQPCEFKRHKFPTKAEMRINIQSHNFATIDEAYKLVQISRLLCKRYFSLFQEYFASVEEYEE